MLTVSKCDLISCHSQWDLGLCAHNELNYVFYQMDKLRSSASWAAASAMCHSLVHITGTDIQLVGNKIWRGNDWFYPSCACQKLSLWSQRPFCASIKAFFPDSCAGARVASFCNPFLEVFSFLNCLWAYSGKKKKSLKEKKDSWSLMYWKLQYGNSFCLSSLTFTCFSKVQGENCILTQHEENNSFYEIPPITSAESELWHL